ncbi:MAG: hypothetical protein IK997_07440 [Bacilli bacterium]|nr:hypothetical protein [Bacilli bacterium]
MEEINLVEIFSYFKSKIVPILIVIGVILVVGNIYSIFLKTPMYQSNTTVLLVNSKNNNTTELQLNKNLVTTYTEIIKSRRVLTQVIKEGKLDCSVAELSNMISVEAVGDTELIRITVKNPNKKKASIIADQIADTFIKEIKDLYHLENVSVVDKAIVNNNAYNINYLKDNIIYLGIGIVLTFGIVFVMYYFDTTIKSTEVVENKLGLTVIGIVPEEKDRG